MWADLVALMKDGVRKGRIDTVRDEHLPHVTGRAPRVDRHGGEVYVYRRTDHAVPGVRHSRPQGGTGGPQPLLVPDLPGLKDPFEVTS